MANKNEVMVNETNDLATIDNDALMEMFGERSSAPAILMLDTKKVMKPAEVINLASGENKSLSEIINKEVILQGYGAVKLDFVDQETGEFGQYIRYILVTSEGNFTTTSAFIGRTLKMLYQVASGSLPIMFKQVEKDGKRKFVMELIVK